jgi:superfamily II DNA/RNA helicase
MNQRERTRTLQNMRRGQVRTLIATDVAARGIDVAGITHVINFDLPRQAEDYVHRIGRTGRAGATGIAISLANHGDRGALRQIERFTGIAIPAHVIRGLEPRARGERRFDAPQPAHRHSAPRGAGHAGHKTPAAPGGFRAKPRYGDRNAGAAPWHESGDRRRGGRTR